MFQKFTRLLLASCCLATVAMAQDGTLDGSFGTSGKVWDPPSTYPISTTTPGTISRILVQPDGKILHIAPTGSVGVHITRYLPDGVIDGAFGTGGSVTTNEIAGVYQPKNAYMLPDGRFYVIGESRVNEFGAEHGFAVLRYLANGILDNSFSGDGKTVIPLATSVPVAHGIAVQGDGKIVVTGNAGQWTTVRFHPDGSIDNSFDGDGIVRTTWSGNDIAYAVTMAADGKIVVAGQVTNQSVVNGQTVFSQDLGIVRYNPDGSPDGSFGNGGKVTHITSGILDGARGVAISPSTGKIYVGGDWMANNDGDNTGYFAARFNVNGTLDGSYNGGYASFNIVGRARATDMRMQTDEKIIIGGYNTCGMLCPTEGWVDIHLARLTTAGGLDPSFDFDGKAKIEYQFLPPPNPGSVDMGGSIDGQASRIITGGLSRFSGQTKKFLVRLQNSAALLPRDLQGSTPLTYVPIPATLEAEAYTAQSGTQVEATTDAGGGQNVGYMDQGDYLEYRISVPATGDYTLSLRVASFMSNASIEVRTGTGQVLTIVSVPNTGGWQNWTTLTAPVSLTAGNHTIRLTSQTSSGWNINWLKFEQGIVQPPPPTYVPIPAKIEAEAYVNQSGTQLEGTTDAGGGQNVGWIDMGDYLEYNIATTSGGTFTFAARVASEQTGGTLELRTSGGSLLGTIAIPNTGGWQAWTTVTTSVNIPAGNHRIVIVSTAAANWNINWIEFSQGTTPPPGYVLIPARIQAEAFAQHQGTQNEPTADAGGGQNVGYIDAGDWLDYQITAPAAGAYTLSLRVASTMAGAQVGIYNQTGQLLGTISVPNTGGWQTWTTESTVINLPAGNQVIRLLSLNSSNWNINWLEFAHATVTPPGYVMIPAKIEAEAYTAQTGTQLEATSDAGGGQNVGYVNQGDWLEYNISAPTAGTYFLDLRVASFFDGGIIEVRNSANTLLAAYHVPNTGGWQNWTTITRSLVLPQGDQTIRLISAHSSGWNLNWLQFSQTVGRRPEITAAGSNQIELAMYPNPAQDQLSIALKGIGTGSATVEVVGINGAVWSKSIFNKEGNTGQLKIPVSQLHRGQYFLRISMNGWTTTRKFTKL